MVDGQVLCLNGVSMNVDTVTIVVNVQNVGDNQDTMVVDGKARLKGS